MQNSLSRKSSTTWKQSTTFSPAEISQSQIINNMETFKVFFACRNVLAANHHYPENIHSLFRLQNCLGRRSSIPRKKSKSFPPAELSQPQIINNLTWRKSRLFSPAESSWPQIIDTPKIFKDFFTCRIVLAENDQQHGNIQIFSTCRTILAANHQQPGNSQRHFHRQKYLSLKLSTTWKNSKIFLLAKLSYPQIIDTPKIFKQFFTCRYV